MREFWNDLRFALRSLAKSPTVLIVAVLSLAIGIGAATTVFSMANAVLLRPPAVDLDDDVVGVFTSDDDGELYGDVSYPDFLDAVGEVEAISTALLHRLGGVDLEAGGARRRLVVELVAGSYFELMGLDLALGRGFSAEEVPIGTAERLVVLSHALWRDDFGADPGVLGREVRLGGQLYTVVGVGPEGYLSRFFGMRVDAWMPMGVPGGVYNVSAASLADRGDRQYRMLARLRPGADLAQAQAQLALLADRLHGEHPSAWADHLGRPRAFTALDEEEALLPGPIGLALGGTFGLLLLLTGVILLIACSNVASLFLARAHRRRREMALRLALGAGRRRLVAMLLTESLVPALGAGLLGALLAAWAAESFGSIVLPFGFPLQFDFHLDHRVLAFTLLLSVATCVLFGLVPALEGASPDLVSSLKADAGTGDRGGRRPRGGLRLRRWLVIAQVAASVVFLLGAGLALRGLEKAVDQRSELDVERRALMSRQLPEDVFAPEAGRRHLEEVVERLRRRPEIAAAHLASSAELTFLTGAQQAEVAIEGHERAAGERMSFAHNAVTPGYLEMLGLPLLRGRTIEERDRPGAPYAAVVNQAFVERFWPGESGLGRRFRILGGETVAEGPAGAGEPHEVVGVVASGRYGATGEVGEPFLWTALAQGWSWRVILHVEGRTRAGEALRALYEEVELAPGETPLLPPIAHRELADLELLAPRGVARLLGWGGLFGSLLAAMGLYGVVAFMVRLRHREMAIRQALGARPEQLVWTAAGDGLGLALRGVLVGLAVALPLAALLRSALYGVSPLDPLAVGGSVGLLLLAALVASVVPARRLLGGQPMATLRGE